MPRVDADERERSVPEAQTAPAAAEQTPEASLASESPNRRKRRMKTRYGLTPEIIAHLCCNKENVSS